MQRPLTWNTSPLSLSSSPTQERMAVSSPPHEYQVDHGFIDLSFASPPTPLNFVNQVSDDDDNDDNEAHDDAVIDKSILLSEDDDHFCRSPLQEISLSSSSDEEDDDSIVTDEESLPSSPQPRPYFTIITPPRYPRFGHLNTRPYRPSIAYQRARLYPIPEMVEDEEDQQVSRPTNAVPEQHGPLNAPISSTVSSPPSLQFPKLQLWGPQSPIACVTPPKEKAEMYSIPGRSKPSKTKTFQEPTLFCDASSFLSSATDGMFSKHETNSPLSVLTNARKPKKWGDEKSGSGNHSFSRNDSRLRSMPTFTG